MPPIEQMDRYDLAVLWPLVGHTADGQPYVSQDTREEILVRWNHSRRQITDARNNTVVIDGDVTADRDAAPGSILWEGAEVDIPGTSYVPSGNLFMVYSSDKVDDIKGRFTKYEWLIVRYGDTLPLGETS